MAFLLIGGGTVLGFILLLAIGTVSLPVSDVVAALLGEETSREVYTRIVWEARLPKAVTAILVGAALGIAGAQMQTIFRNPLADPYVLGISSGAELGAALLILGGGGLAAVTAAPALRQFGVTGAAVAGALAVLFVAIFAVRRVTSPATVLIAGVMFGFLTQSFVDVLIYYSEPEELAAFTGFMRGSVRSTGWSDLAVLGSVSLVALVVGVALAKPLNAMLLGDRYAASMGVPVRRVQAVSLISVGVLAGVGTAYCGVIGFVGIAAPHLVRGLFQTNDHRIVLPASAAVGAMIVLWAELVAQGPAGTTVSLPLNSVTALVGVPVVLWTLVGRGRSSGMD